MKYGGGIGLQDVRTRLRVIAYNLDFTQSVKAEATITVLLPATVELWLSGSSSGYITLPGQTNELDLWRLPSNVELGHNLTVRLRADTNGFKEWRGATNSTNPIIELKLEQSQELQLVHEFPPDYPRREVVGKGQIIFDPPPPYNWDAVVQISAVADPGYFFVGWDHYDGASKPSSYPIFLAQSSFWDTPLRALFAPLPEGYHALNVVGSGNITFGKLQRYAFTNGTRVGVSAYVGDARIFAGWSGDATGATPYTELVMDKSRTITGATRKVTSWNSSFSATTSPAVGNDGTVYAGMGERLVAYDERGLMKWLVKISNGSMLLTPVIGPDETLYAFNQEVIAAVTPRGKVLWRVHIGGEHLAVSAEGLYLSSTNGLVRQIGTGGAVLKTLQLQPTSGTNSYGVALDAAGNLYAHDQFTLISLTSNLVERFRRVYPAALRKGSLGIGADGNVYFGTGNELVAMNPEGRELWNNPFDVSRGTTVGSNRVYINAIPPEDPLQAGPVEAVGIDGLMKWEGFTIAPEERSISTTVTEDGTLLHLSTIVGTSVSDSHASLRQLKPDGSVIADYHFKYEDSYPSPPVAHGVLGPDGMYYFVAGALRAVPTGLKPAKTGWPMPRGDWRNSGQAYVGDIPGPPEDALQVRITPNLMTLRFEASVDGTFKLESSSDLRTWTEAQSFTNVLNLELPFPTNRQGYFRVVRAAGN